APRKTTHAGGQALAARGVNDHALRRYGLRLLKVGMLFPAEPGVLTEFARGLEEILVVEEKRPFVELFARDALYNAPVRPRIVGTTDERGEVLVLADGELDADRVAIVI